MRYFLFFLHLLRRGRRGGPAGVFLLAGALLLGAPAAHAQVVDDSTKVLYGPKTTRVIYEAEVLRDSTAGTPVDTSLVKLPQIRFWMHDSTFQQDLGTVGSASRPLLYQPNLKLGARLGRNVFDKYARESSDIPYYDSRSPYSFFRILQSTSGEQVFEISYSRSLKKNFSVGAAYERIASNKIIGTTSGAVGGVGLVEHSNLLFFTRYQSENGRYRLLANISTSRQRAVEQGGVWPRDTEKRDTVNRVQNPAYPGNLFNYSSERVYLAQAQNTENRDQLHAFQSYRLLGRGLTAYHVLDFKHQYNNYSDGLLPRNLPDTTLLFYPNTKLRTKTSTLDRVDYKQVENTFGLLGHINALGNTAVEYRVYGRLRNAFLAAYSDTAYVIQPTTPSGIPTAATRLQRVQSRNYLEEFVGGTAAFNYRGSYAVEVAGELKVPDLGLLRDSIFRTIRNSEYWLRGTIRTGPLSGEILITSYSPTLTQREFLGNHYKWQYADKNGNATFKNTSTQQFTGRLRQALPGFADHLFEASASVVNLVNYVYYDKNGTPAQLSTTKQLLIGSARHRVRFGRFGFDNQGIYTYGAGNEGAALRIPALVTESRAYYQSYIFGRAMFTQVGLEFYYQSRFKGYGYSPSTQQFYLQDDFTIRNYGVASAFFAADIKTVSVFLKVPYLNQGLAGQGYFASPFYPAYPRRLQFGLNWKFFN
ncbi:putative porin [Hymenobacter nivis]|uniref:putative porin n=1 Tax=Hymenobacter nivis TaxID=1850093 RepID=UPI0013A56DDB|nr:putative porin [Hymenobacter nivis]